ncbi:MAG: hypothetical protein WD079_00760, partial [Phycisphaeraceae bacterium]
TINVVAVFFVIILLALVGVSLAAWYMVQPDAGMPQDADDIFPHFVSTQLPIGAAGLLLAAILAATMSSVTSGINALAGSITRDFVSDEIKKDPRRQLRIARFTSFAIGIIATVLAGLVDQLGDIFDISQAVLGVFLGPLLCVAILALTTRLRVNPLALCFAMVVGCVVGWVVTFTDIYNTWVAPAAFLSTFITAIVFTPIVEFALPSSDSRLPDPAE